MKILCLFLKKIFEKKLTLILNSITLSIGLFLASLFLNMGLNIVAEIDRLNETNPNYSLIFVEPTDESEDFINTEEKGFQLASIRYDHECVLKIGDLSVDLPVAEYSQNSDTIFLSKNIVKGSTDNACDCVWIGKSIIDTINLPYDEVVGQKIELLNRGICVIAGIYNDEDSIIFDQCIVFTDEEFEAEAFYIDVNNINNVQSVVEELECKKFKVLSHNDEINSLRQYIRLIIISVIILCVLVIVSSSFILYGSLKISFTEKYRCLALLKAVGYTKVHYTIFVAVESLVIFGLGTVMSFAAYIFGLPAIKTLLKANRVEKIFEISVNELFAIKYMSFAIVIVVTAVFAFVVSLLCVKFVEKRQIHEILFEGSQ